MRVLLLTSIYPPDAGNAKRRSELAAGLVQAGHEVTVLAPFPHYPTGIVSEHYRGKLYEWAQEDGVCVLRLPVFPDARKTFAVRAINFASFLVSSMLGGLVLRGRYDVLVTISPSLLNGLSAIVISALRRIPFVFDVQDIYPETAVALGVLRNRLLIGALERLERWIYRRSARIVVLSPGFAADIEAKGVPAEKIALVPNWVDADLFRPLPGELRNDLGLAGKFVVIFSGTIGLAQGLSTLLDAAELLRGDPRFHILVLGEGVERRPLEERARQAGLANVTFLPLRPREEVPRYIAAADATLVHLKKKWLYTITIPCKTYEYMAMAKPVLMGVAGDAARMVTESGCGVAVEQEDAADLARGIQALASNQGVLAEMGRRGREVALIHYSRPAVVAQYVRLLENVVERNRQQV